MVPRDGFFNDSLPNFQKLQTCIVTSHGDAVLLQLTENLPPPASEVVSDDKPHRLLQAPGFMEGFLVGKVLRYFFQVSIGYRNLMFRAGVPTFRIKPAFSVKQQAIGLGKNRIVYNLYWIRA